MTPTQRSLIEMAMRQLESTLDEYIAVTQLFTPENLIPVKLAYRYLESVLETE